MPKRKAVRKHEPEKETACASCALCPKNISERRAFVLSQAEEPFCCMQFFRFFLFGCVLQKKEDGEVSAPENKNRFSHQGENGQVNCAI